MHNEAIERSAQLLRQAIPLMARQNAALHPISYAVWYEYLSGTNANLKRELEALTSGDRRLDETQTLMLYNRHIGGIDTTAAEQLRDRFAAVLQRMNTSAAEASKRALEYGTVLEGWGGELASMSGPGEAMAGIGRMLAHTREMESAVSHLKNRLEESRVETERLQAELHRAREESLTDALTGLTNRKGFDLALTSCLAELSRSSGPCIAMADLDHFKRVNDTHGHMAGDRALQAVANILLANVKGRDTAARYGGEEFVMLLPGTPLDGARSLAEQIRASVARCAVTVPESGQPLVNITVSIGVTVYHAGETAEAFLQRADHALYLSKKRGRNCVTAFQ